jgi:hypothetical protein
MKHDYFPRSKLFRNLIREPGTRSSDSLSEGEPNKAKGAAVLRSQRKRLEHPEMVQTARNKMYGNDSMGYLAYVRAV